MSQSCPFEAKPAYMLDHRLPDHYPKDPMELIRGKTRQLCEFLECVFAVEILFDRKRDSLEAVTVLFAIRRLHAPLLITPSMILKFF